MGIIEQRRTIYVSSFFLSVSFSSQQPDIKNELLDDDRI
jgi:hypothetical protein